MIVRATQARIERFLQWLRLADRPTLNTSFTSCPYCKTIVVTDCVLKYFGVQHDFLQRPFTNFYDYQPVSHVLIKWGLLACYPFINIKLALCSLQVPKIICIFVQLLQTRTKGGPVFILAHPVGCKEWNNVCKFTINLTSSVV